jgi:hypothetical protein
MRRALDSPLYYTHKLYINKLHEKAARRHDKRAAPILLPGRSPQNLKTPPRLSNELDYIDLND